MNVSIFCLSIIFIRHRRRRHLKIASSTYRFFLTSRAGGALSRGATPPGTRLSAAGSAALGSLRLLLQYTVDHVFPLDHYRQLEECFLRSVHQKVTDSLFKY